MNKTELINQVSERMEDVTKKDVVRMVDTLLATITDTLCSGEGVQLVGFGSFEVRNRPARTGRNPQTGEAIPIAESYAPVFRAGKPLREQVNQAHQEGSGSAKSDSHGKKASREHQDR